MYSAEEVNTSIEQFARSASAWKVQRGTTGFFLVYSPNDGLLLGPYPPASKAVPFLLLVPLWCKFQWYENCTILCKHLNFWSYLAWNIPPFSRVNQFFWSASCKRERQVLQSHRALSCCEHLNFSWGHHLNFDLILPKLYLTVKFY